MSENQITISLEKWAESEYEKYLKMMDLKNQPDAKNLEFFKKVWKLGWIFCALGIRDNVESARRTG